ncbi:hypothetical protein [Chishuiella sp.]|uniref:tetratricopeptide repeat protein n=1 Tax=Chishuiella sp. TaxID=1969467 RepID=UPI0028B0A7AB|nr:hypothetical protein [Chishuiella sp.]
MKKNVCFIIVLFFILSCSNHSKYKKELKSSDYYFNLGKKYGEANQGNEMELIYYDSAILVNPNVAKIWWEKSTWQVKIGNYKKYFEYMDKAVELDPDVYIGWRGVIKMYYLHDFDGALKDFFALQKLHPKTKNLAARGEDLNYLIGNAYWQKKDFTKAVEYFNKNIKENGEKSVDVYNFIYLGICYYEMGNNSLAEMQFNKALSLSKEIVDAHYYLAKIYSVEKKQKLAEKHINKAIYYANDGYLKIDGYRDVLGQIYHSDLISLKDSIVNAN